MDAMDRRIVRIALLVALAGSGQAQTSRGTVTGTVTDPAAGVVAQVAVELVNTATGLKLTSATNGSGLYRFDAVDPGSYQLRVSHVGFAAFIANGLTVEANRVLVEDVTLQLGSQTTSIDVDAGSELLARDGPLHGDNFSAREVSQLPLTGLTPLSLARAVAGVIQPSGSTVAALGGGVAVQYAINGQRVTGNNFLLDGTDNNDIEYTGVAQPFNIADAVEEVSVQTSNFSVEFGRAAGGVLNVVTKSGTNNLHGTLYWRYQSEIFDSIDNLSRLNGAPRSVFVHNIPGFTAGAPIRKDKTFFFVGAQYDTNHSTTSYPLVVPTTSAVQRLQQFFPLNPRLELYLGALGNIRGTGAAIAIALGADPVSGIDRGSIQFATANLVMPPAVTEPEGIARIDEYLSSRHRFSARYTYDSSLTSPSGVDFPGYVLNSDARNQNLLFSDSYVIRPDYSNELRLSYVKTDVDNSKIAPQSVAAAQMLPQLIIQNVAAPGVPSGRQYRHARNFLVQETQTRLTGRHTLRYGLEFFRQMAVEQGTGFPLGQITFASSPGYSAFANFIEDYSGLAGRIQRTIGGGPFHPNDFRQSYFFQDTWKATASLTITGGLRYENFGQPANALRYPAFTGFDPALFFQPSHVNADDRDFGPGIGLAWSPHRNANTVLRSGYQISYAPVYTQILALDLSTATPNAISIDRRPAGTTGRGDPNWYEQLPAATATASLLDAQYGTLQKNFRTPYTERWSFGVQRLVGHALLDLSYIGAESHELTTRADLNPLEPDGVRLYPDFGDRTVRTSQGNSSYQGLQMSIVRRLSHGVQVTAAYTWSKSLDSTSEGIGQVNGQYNNANLTSVPIAQGGLKLDRGLSDFNRSHRLTISFLWSLPGPSRVFWGAVAGGWSIAGITTFQTGTPFTVVNGFDRNGDGWPEDRPDVGNAMAPLNTRAVLVGTTGAQGCASGYRNPDTTACTTPQAVHWVEGSGFPNGATVGRNTLLTGGTNNFDASLFKTFRAGDRGRVELRCEAQNTFNHPQYVQVPPMDVVNTPAREFLNRSYTDAGIRSFWLQVKWLF
jgi:hypothetical protein